MGQRPQRAPSTGVVARQRSVFAPERSRKDVPTFPITAGGEQIGYIIIDANPEYFALQFRDMRVNAVAIAENMETPARLAAEMLDLPILRLAKATNW